MEPFSWSGGRADDNEFFDAWGEKRVAEAKALAAGHGFLSHMHYMNEMERPQED